MHVAAVVSRIELVRETAFNLQLWSQFKGSRTHNMLAGVFFYGSGLAKLLDFTAVNLANCSLVAKW